MGKVPKNAVREREVCQLRAKATQAVAAYGRIPAAQHYSISNSARPRASAHGGQEKAVLLSFVVLGRQAGWVVPGVPHATKAHASAYHPAALKYGLLAQQLPMIGLCVHVKQMSRMLAKRSILDAGQL